MNKEKMQKYMIEVEELSCKIRGNYEAMQGIEIAMLEGPFEASGFLPAITYLNNEMDTLTKKLVELVESRPNLKEE